MTGVCRGVFTRVGRRQGIGDPADLAVAADTLGVRGVFVAVDGNEDVPALKTPEATSRPSRETTKDGSQEHRAKPTAAT